MDAYKQETLKQNHQANIFIIKHNRYSWGEYESITA